MSALAAADPGRSADPPKSALARWGPAGALVAVYLAAALPLILSGNSSGRGAFDALTYHLPAIRTFAAELPRPDLELYPSSTTPLYHLVLALVARLIDPSPVVLQLVGCLFSVGLLGTLGRWCAGQTDPWCAFACCLPFGASSYVLQSGVWTLPDNASWWGVLGVLLVALDQRPRGWWMCAGGLVLLALVLTRQIHLWAAAVVWLSAWLGPPSDTGPRPSGPSPAALTPSRVRRTTPAFMSTLPAFAALCYFAWLWGGLTPPMFQTMFSEPGYSAPAFLLALLACFSVFYAPFVVGPLAGLLERAPWVIVIAGAGGALIALLPATTYSEAEGRFSGLWNVSGVLGTLWGRTSVLLLLMSAAGGITVAGWAAALRFRDRLFFLGALAAFGAAQVATPMVYQRYQEPFVLVLLALMAVRVPPGSGDDAAVARVLRAGRVAGPFALGVLWACLTVATQVRAVPTKGMPLDPKAREHPVWGE